MKLWLSKLNIVQSVLLRTLIRQTLRCEVDLHNQYSFFSQSLINELCMDAYFFSFEINFELRD